MTPPIGLWAGRRPTGQAGSDERPTALIKAVLPIHFCLRAHCHQGHCRICFEQWCRKRSVHRLEVLLYPFNLSSGRPLPSLRIDAAHCSSASPPTASSTTSQRTSLRSVATERIQTPLLSSSVLLSRTRPPCSQASASPSIIPTSSLILRNVLPDPRLSVALILHLGLASRRMTAARHDFE